jgi:NADH:ubiquinone oxidoreductase subunit F (NADH-binding)
MLVTVLGAVGLPGVHEVPIGVPVRDVLGAACGPTGPLRALLVGGYFGVFVPAREALPLPFSRRGLQPLGASPGAGVLVAVPAGACGVVEAAGIVEHLAGQSAGCTAAQRSS